MNETKKSKRLVVERSGGRMITHVAEVSSSEVLNALRQQGVALKISKNYVVRRVGEWVVKESRFRGGAGPLRHTIQRARYRRGWVTSNWLEDHGVPVPKPIAFVERSLFGIIMGNALVAEYLDGCVNVEVWAARLVEGKVSQERIVAFLAGLAGVLNRLAESGAYHSDLSGKNIFTCDGSGFRFIDLDGVVLDVPYTSERRLRNHVQLCDSFCDLLDEGLLRAFFGLMLPDGTDADDWFARVREGQKERRNRQEEIWRRQGRC